ncbi:peptidase G2 autoproteolytic cleavage domain-containing protein [Halobacillus andaensis]|uniref:peptidase G2 autoproteolytic cleavage domain-containing protein n=1 Tax=Halobacillus andaensis TaxID=1176239 RepID=UPI003D72CD42
MGRFGDTDEANSWFIGNGTSEDARGIGAKWSGSTFDMSIDGDMYITGGADYGEMFETIDGNSIDVGYFVTPAQNDKIRKATSSDKFILEVTSATSSLVGNSAALSWQGKYIRDEWGRKQYHEVTIPGERDSQGNIHIPKRTENQVQLNPDWNAEQPYVSRLERPEWVRVGLVGQILVRDDGTCETHSYCWPNDEGIATHAEKGYFVLKRTSPNQILVLAGGSLQLNESITQADQLRELAQIKEQCLQQLERLIQIKEQGYLTEEEFQREKQKLLH